MDGWIGRAVAMMHENHITGGQLAKHMGVRREYISMILNGKRNPKGAEEKIFTAIEELINAG